MATQNIQMTRGNDLTLNIAVTLNGSAFNLTGSTLRMTAKWNQSDTDSQAVFSISSPTSGITITNASGGLATIIIPSSATNISSFPLHEAFLYYDIQLTDSGGKKYTVLYGLLKVLPNITQTSP